MPYSSLTTLTLYARYRALRFYRPPVMINQIKFVGYEKLF